jgi:hypothetical protein
MLKKIFTTFVLCITSTVTVFADNYSKADIGLIDDYNDGGDSMWFWLIIIGGVFIKGLIDGIKS